MDRIIVYVDDAAQAEQQLAPMKDGRATHWVVVACAPRMTHRISKWVSHSARENWRTKWADRLFAQVLPMLTAPGSRLTPVIAKGPLAELTAQLVTEHGVARVLDARRPKFAHDLEPVTSQQPATHNARWAVPGAVAGLGMALMLAAE